MPSSRASARRRSACSAGRRRCSSSRPSSSSSSRGSPTTATSGRRQGARLGGLAVPRRRDGANIATFPPSWMVALPRPAYREALAMTQASTALSRSRPPAPPWAWRASYAMLRSWGFDGRPVGLAVAVTGIWNQFANLTFPVVALALLTGRTRTIPRCARRRSSASSSSSSRSPRSRSRCRARRGRADRRPRGSRLARWAGGLFGGSPAGAGRARALPVGRARPSPEALARAHVATLVGHLTVFLLLLACLRVVGVGSGDHLDRGLRGLGARPDPGGASAHARRHRDRRARPQRALVAFGAANADAVAATLLYRAFTVLPTLGLGMLAAATWRTHIQGSR